MANDAGCTYAHPVVHAVFLTHAGHVVNDAVHMYAHPVMSFHYLPHLALIAVLPPPLASTPQIRRNIHSTHEASAPHFPSRHSRNKERESHNQLRSASPTRAGSTRKRYQTRSPPTPGSSFPCRQPDRRARDDDLRTKKEKGEFFLPGAGPRGGVCAHCLSAHDHIFATCDGKKLWDGLSSPIKRGEHGKLVDPDGVALCFDWQLPGGCQNSHHSQRHKCSGCGKSGHGAQACP